MSTERRAPVQGNRRIKQGDPGNAPGTIAWDEHEQAWRVYNKRFGGGQSAERIAERQGFCYLELTDFLGHAPATWAPTADPGRSGK